MYKDILLPVDLEHDSSWEKSLPVAVEYCNAFGSQLHVMTVMPDYRMAIVGSYFPENFEEKARTELNQHLHDFVKQHIPESVQVQHIVGEGRVYEEIIRVAHDINVDLIVMARRQPDLKDYLLGPNCERVARHAERSILIVQD